MIEVNLIPEEVMIRNAGRARCHELSLLCSVCVIILSVAASLHSRGMMSGGRGMVALQAELDALEKKRTDSERALAEIEFARERGRKYTLLRGFIVRTLKAMSDAVPERMTLIETRIAEDFIEMSGVADDQIQIANFIRDLAERCTGLAPVVERSHKEVLGARVVEKFAVHGVSKSGAEPLVWCR